MFPAFSHARDSQGPRRGAARTARLLALAGLAIPAFLCGALLLSGCRQDVDSPAQGPIKVPVKAALPLERADVVEYEDLRGQTKADQSVDLH